MTKQSPMFNFQSRLFYVDLELSNDTMFDMIGPVVPLKKLVENRLFCI